MGELLPKLDSKATCRKVQHFLTDDLERLTLQAGHKLTDISSPQLTFAPGHTGGNHNEDSIIRGLNAGAYVMAVHSTIFQLPDASRIIILGLFIDHDSWQHVSDMVRYEHTQFSLLRNKALLEFADGFDYWERRLQCDPVIDLHVYEQTELSPN